jgi:hypothetical protein
MTQAELHRAVARATGESVITVRRLGFRLAAPDDGNVSAPDAPDGQDHGPRVIDWDSRQDDKTSASRRSPTESPVCTRPLPMDRGCSANSPVFVPPTESEAS